MTQKKHVKTKLLLLEDVTNLGNKGELAAAKPGFIRNFLLPQRKAVIADKRTIRLQEQLQKERELQAIEDKKEAKALADRLKEKTLTITAKNDSQGHLYGSVAHADIIHILSEQEGVTVERKNVILSKPIKMVGVYTIDLKLKENVSATFTLKIEGETEVRVVQTPVEVVEEKDPALAEDDATSEGELPTEVEQEREEKKELEERTKE